MSKYKVRHIFGQKNFRKHIFDKTYITGEDGIFVIDSKEELDELLVSSNYQVLEEIRDEPKAEELVIEEPKAEELVIEEPKAEQKSEPKQVEIFKKKRGRKKTN